MHSIRIFVLITAVLSIGRVSTLAADSNPALTRAEAEVSQRLQEVFDAAAKKDMARLDSYHLYGPKFTKFGTGASGRLDGNAARESEHKGLTGLADLSIRADQLKIDVFGDTAVATFIGRADAKRGNQAIHSEERTTIVLVRNAGSWKIVHEHFSPFKSSP
jgi:ketosteroid isomerase-like protein